MDHPPTLAAALVHRAAATPHAPWLFEPQGWDWRWRPFAAAAAAVEQATRTLAGAFPPGTRVALADLPRPETIVLDLGIQGAGLVSVPLSPDHPSFDARALVTIAGEDDHFATSPLERIAVPVTWEGEPGGREPRLPAPQRSPSTFQLQNAGTRDSEAPAAEALARRASGGTLVEASTSAAPTSISAAALATAAAALADRLGSAPGRARDVVVSAGPFLAPAERRLLAWATSTGAAVLLVPPTDRVATAAWARVTVFLGNGEEVAALAHAAGLGARRRFAALRSPRRPFGRLRAVVATTPPPAEAAAFLRDRGVALLGPEALE